MRHLVRRVAASAAALLAAGLLAGCTPANKPVTALRWVNGHAVLLIACPTMPSDRISVYLNSGSPSTAWTIDRAAQAGGLPGQVTLFEAPGGWTVSDGSLTALQPGVRYDVWVLGHAKSVPITFTVADLTALAGDQVLVGEPASRSKVVSESTFRADAKKACD
jgi:hypothetical protein